MCFKRSDGTKVKGMGIIEQAGSFFMPNRDECVNYFIEDFRCEPIDDFINRERKNGVTFSYLHILIASIVRLYYLRPKLNRFINNCVTYEHNTISVSMVVKSSLSDSGEEIMMKLEFTGRESLYEVKEIIDKGIASNLSQGDSNGGTGKAANFLNHLPAWLYRLAMSFVRWLDKHNMLPKKLIKASPFHCSCFVTHLKSLKQEAVFHHLYNFGTCSVFVALGKEKIRPTVENNKEIKMAKLMKIAFSMDDRTADGFYYSKSVKMLKSMMENPDCLMDSMPDDGKKNLVIKRKKKKGDKVKKQKAEKVKKEKTLKPRKSKKTKEQIEKQKLLKQQARERKEAIRAKIKAEKEEIKEIRKKERGDLLEMESNVE